MSLHPIIARSLAPWSPPNSSVRSDAEEAKWLEADVAYQRFKDEGALHRYEEQRAVREELNWGLE